MFFLVKGLSFFRDVYLLLVLVIRNFLVDERGKGLKGMKCLSERNLERADLMHVNSEIMVESHVRNCWK